MPAPLLSLRNISLSIGRQALLSDVELTGKLNRSFEVFLEHAGQLLGAECCRAIYDFGPGDKVDLVQADPFDGAPTAFSPYIHEFASRLLSSPEGNSVEATGNIVGQPLLVRLAICHELMDELYESVFETKLSQPRTPDWVLPNVVAQIPRFKDIVQLIYPESNPRLVFLTWQAALEGFDSIDSVGVIYELLETNVDRSEGTPHRVSLSDPAIREWQTANDVCDLFAIAIQARRERELELAGWLGLLLAKECDSPTSAAMASILRRFGQLCEIAFDIAGTEEPIEKPDTE